MIFNAFDVLLWFIEDKSSLVPKCESGHLEHRKKDCQRHNYINEKKGRCRNVYDMSKNTHKFSRKRFC